MNRSRPRFATPPWPLVAVRVSEDGATWIEHLGTTYTIQAQSPAEARELVREWITARVARPAGRLIAVTVTDPDGLWHLTVSPDGQISPSDHGTDRPSTPPPARRVHRGALVGAGVALLAVLLAAAAVLVLLSQASGRPDPPAEPTHHPHTTGPAQQEDSP